jgi:hypothetical protein
MQGNVAFLMKDVVLLAVSVYLLKQDLVRALSPVGAARNGAEGLASASLPPVEADGMKEAV